MNYPYYTIRTKRPADAYGVNLTFQFGLDDDPALVANVIQAIKDHFNSIPDHGTVYTDKYEVTDSSF